MNSKKLGILFAVAVIAIAAGVWLAGQRSVSSGGTSSAALYPEAQKKLDGATAVRIFTAGDELAVEIAREDDAWRDTLRDGYPAAEAKLRKLLLSIADAKIREEKTSNPDNYASLGVEDISDASATGIRVEVSGVEPPINLIVGKQGPGVDSQYVRRAGEAQSWLIDASIDKSSKPQDWLSTSIIDIRADRAQSAEIKTEGAKPYSAAKSSRADANFTIEKLPKGKELSSPSAPNSLASALTALSLSDVQPASAFDEKPQAHATYRTFDGLVVELDGWTREDKHFIAARAQYDAALAARFKVPSEEKKASEPSGDSEGAPASKDEADETVDEAGASTDAAAEQDVAAEAKELNGVLNGWVYEVPQYKYEAIFKPLSEMLKE
jgi:hypothetical protein